jgi:EAL domain-containing protein (putative c-di-GMP-specific phosphodiesterase class I)
MLVQAPSLLSSDTVHRALECGEFTLLYQPIVEMQRDGRSVRALALEAYLRWRHPQFGLLSAGTFLPRAQAMGLTAALDRWVMQRACDDAARWRCKGLEVGVVVNISPRQIKPGFRDAVTAALVAAELDPTALALDLTSEGLLVTSEATQAQLTHLRGMGVGLAADDFGTGYSTLGYLRELPFDTVKIDGSFLTVWTRSDASVVRAIVELCASHGLNVIAEGVETPSQRDRLLEVGCTRMQGYLFGRPVSAQEVISTMG